MEDAQLLINLGFTLFGVVLAIVINQIFKGIKEVRDDSAKVGDTVHNLSVTLPTKYVSKEDFQYIIDALFQKLDRIEEKLDRKEDKK